MSDESINKFLCEKVEKKCWHDDLAQGWHQGETEKACSKCGQIFPDHPDYLHSGDDYLRLMQAAMKEEWWEKFVWTVPATWLDTLEIFVTPSRGARALAEFLGYKEDGNG